MTDIFDEVDSILNEDNFNESELKDIMDEIEDLENEIMVSDKSNVESKKPTVESVQNKTEIKLVNSENSKVNESEKLQSPSLKFTFLIGKEEATISYNSNSGFVLNMNGVELLINEKEGCKVLMKNGVQFNIPLAHNLTDIQKKSA